MNKYFTKEYVKECNCEKIQKLEERDDHNWIYLEEPFLREIHRIYNRIELRDVISYKVRKVSTIWLPTGDQLDEEIVKICKGTNGYYEFSYTDRTYPNKFFKNYTGIVGIAVNNINITVEGKNPLLVKIKLLKELLNEK